MFGYPHCAMYRNGEITEEIKKSLEEKKAKIKEEIEKNLQEKSNVIDFITRQPLKSKY